MEDHNCILVTIINPGCYTLLSQEREHCSLVKHVEEQLAKEIEHYNKENYSITLRPHMNIAVKYSDSSCKRGQIRRKLNGDTYEVFLIDSAEVIKVEKSNIFLLMDSNFNAVEPLSFTFTLYGLLPSSFCFVNGIKKQKICEDWTMESINFVQELFTKDKEIVIKINLIYKDMVYGDIFVKKENKMFSLRKLLIKHQFCVFSEDYFLREVIFEKSESLKTKTSFFQSSEDTSQFHFDSSQSKFHEIKYNEIEKKRKNHTFSMVQDVSEKSHTLKINMGRGKKLVEPTFISNQNTLNNCSSSKFEGNYDHFSPKKDGSIKGANRLKSLPGFLSKVVDSAREVYDSTPESIQEKRVLLKSSSKPVPQTYKDSRTLGETINSSSKIIETSNEILRVSDQLDLNNDSEFDQIFFVNDPMFRSAFSACKTSEANESDEAKYVENFQKKLTSLYEFWEPIVLYKDSAVQPIKKFVDVAVDSKIIQNLIKCSRFRYLSLLQQWAIPSICNRNNVVMIGGSKTGKTLSYVLFLVDFVLKTSMKELPKGNGPVVTIVCSSSSVGELIYSMFNSLLGFVDGGSRTNSKISVVLAHGGGREEQAWVNLTNGCHILISTPHCLVRLLQAPIITNFERLSCLVLDEIDIIGLEPFQYNVRVILEKVTISTKDRFCQKIICGRKWIPSIETLIKVYLKSYTLIISSYLEAAIHARLKPSVYLTDQHRKANILLDKIKDKIEKNKILIMCESASDATYVTNYLTEKGIDTLVAHENTEIEHFKKIHSLWNHPQSYPIIVATDDVLSELRIKNPNILVHFSITTKSKTNFFLRYSAILNNSLKIEEQNRKIKSEDIILLDDTNHVQLPQIVDFITRLGGSVPAELRIKCDEIRRQIEITKKAPICANILGTGFCRNFNNCHQRHAFTKADAPIGHPSNGWVSFSVVKVHNATCFSAILLEHVDSAGKKYEIEHALKISEKLKEFYSFQKNRKVVECPQIGELCATKRSLNLDIFFRAEVVEFVKVDKNNQPLIVNVRLIDEGDYVQLKKTELYILPENLAELSPLTIDVKLFGIQPLDFDINWSRDATNFSKNLMTQKLLDGQHWFGKIVLALRSQLFLNPIMLRRYLPNLNSHVFDLVVQEKFIKTGRAVKNNMYLINLIKLCEEGNIEIPKETGNEIEVQINQPQWAFFEKGFVRVIFSAAKNTSSVFLRLKKYSDLLTDLENICNTEAQKTKEILRSEKGKLKLLPGMFCLVEFEERWYRGRIESQDEFTFYIYFVDYGYFHFIKRESVVPISQKTLLSLPCQAIECNLIGIKPDTDLSLNSIDEIFEFLDGGENDFYAYVFDNNLKAETTDGRKCSLNLLNLKGESFNKYLLDKKMALPLESEINLIRNIAINVSSKESFVSKFAKEDKKSWCEEENLQILNCEERLVKSSEFNTKPEHGLEKYLSELPEDLFENENELNFLKEFASKIFPSASTILEKSLQNNDIENDRNIKNGVDLEVEKIKSSEGNSENKFHILPKINFKRLVNLYRKDIAKKHMMPELKIRSNILTPQVLWCQDLSCIRLKILLSNVEKYRCDCTVTNLLFRCILGEKFYAIDLKLYGSICPEMTRVTVKTFHVIINLKKLCFPLWPRLPRDEGKHCWINLDVDSLKDPENLICDRIQLAKRSIEAGIIKKGVRMEKICSYSDSENSDVDDEITSSETED